MGGHKISRVRSSFWADNGQINYPNPVRGRFCRTKPESRPCGVLTVPIGPGSPLAYSFHRRSLLLGKGFPIPPPGGLYKAIQDFVRPQSGLCAKRSSFAVELPLGISTGQGKAPMPEMFIAQRESFKAASGSATRLAGADEAATGFPPSSNSRVRFSVSSREFRNPSIDRWIWGRLPARVLHGRRSEGRITAAREYRQS